METIAIFFLWFDNFVVLTDNEALVWLLQRRVCHTPPLSLFAPFLFYVCKIYYINFILKYVPSCENKKSSWAFALRGIADTSQSRLSTWLEGVCGPVETPGTTDGSFWTSLWWQTGEGTMKIKIKPSKYYRVIIG